MPVRIEVFDLQGRLIRRLADQRYEPGQWSVDWDGRDSRGNRVAGSVYLCRMLAGSFHEQRSMVLLP